MVVGAVDDGHVDGPASQRLRSSEAAKAAADDHNTGPAARKGLGEVRRRGYAGIGGADEVRAWLRTRPSQARQGLASEKTRRRVGAAYYPCIRLQLKIFRHA